MYQAPKWGVVSKAIHMASSTYRRNRMAGTCNYPTQCHCRCMRVYHAQLATIIIGHAMMASHAQGRATAIWRKHTARHTRPHANHIPAKTSAQWSNFNSHCPIGHALKAAEAERLVHRVVEINFQSRWSVARNMPNAGVHGIDRRIVQ